MWTKDQWMALARDNLAAAKSARDSHPRAAASRAYYAAFSASHGLLLHLGDSPRKTLHTWAHEDLPGSVKAALDRLSENRRANATYRLLIETCYQARLQADYAPGPRVVPVALATESCRLAGQFVDLVEGVLE
jgi:uncharacterized protein (UPF0332 family)